VRAQQRQNQSNTRSSFTPPQSSFLPRIRATTLCSPRSVQSAAAQRVQRSHANNMLGAAVIRPLPGGKRGFSGWTVCLYVFVESRINPQIECAKAWRGKAGNSPHSRHHAQWQPGSLRAASSSTRGGTAPRWGRPSSRQPVPRGTRRKKPSSSAAAQRRLKSLALLLSTPENANERTPQHLHPRAERPTPLASKSSRKRMYYAC
jgi:hypothetical protein